LVIPLDMMSALTPVATIGAAVPDVDIVEGGRAVLIPFGDFVETFLTETDVTKHRGREENEAPSSFAASEVLGSPIALPIMGLPTGVPKIWASDARTLADGDAAAAMPPTPGPVRALLPDPVPEIASAHARSGLSTMSPDMSLAEVPPEAAGPTPPQARRDDPPAPGKTGGQVTRSTENGSEPDFKPAGADKHERLAEPAGIPPRVSEGSVQPPVPQLMPGQPATSSAPAPAQLAAPKAEGAAIGRPPDHGGKALPGHKGKDAETPRPGDETSDKHAHRLGTPHQETPPLPPALSADRSAKLMAGDGSAALGFALDQPHPSPDFPGAQGAEPVATLMTGPASTSSAAQTTATAQSVPFSDADRSIDLGRQLAASLTDLSGRSVEVTLAPEELGRVTMTIASGDGGLTLTLVAERPETLDLMRRNIDQLAQEFRDLGFGTLNFAFSHDGKAQQGAPEPENADEGDKAAPAGVATISPTHSRRLASQNDALDLRL